MLSAICWHHSCLPTAAEPIRSRPYGRAWSDTRKNSTDPMLDSPYETRRHSAPHHGLCTQVGAEYECQGTEGQYASLILC